MLQFENKMADLLNQTYLATANQNNLVNLAKQIGYPMPTYMFKWTDESGICKGGSRPFQYSIPTPESTGKWHSKRRSKKPIKACAHGFHCTSLEDAWCFWDYGPRLFLVEVSGDFDLTHDWMSTKRKSSHCKVAVENIRFVYEFTDIPQEFQYGRANATYRGLQKWLLANFEFPVGTIMSFPGGTDPYFGNTSKKSIGNAIGTIHLGSDGCIV